MSRFDRRLKGAGLRPGMSTCKVDTNKIGNSPNIGQYATMSWDGNVVTGAQAPTYNPNIPAQFSQNSMIQQQVQPVSSAPALQQNLQFNNATPTVRVLDKEHLNMETRMRDLDILAEKNARLEEVEKTAPTQSMRLITRHEIRINILEALSLRMEHLDMIQNGCARMNSLDDKMIEDLKNDLWIQLKSRHDVEVQKVVMGLQDEVVELKMKVEGLQCKLNITNDPIELTKKTEPFVSKVEKITLNIEEKIENANTKGGVGEDIHSVVDEDIHSVVAKAIAQVEAGEA